MKLHPVKVHPSKALLPREEQLAWKMAGIATDKVAVEHEVQEMIINRIIDNASVAIAAINRRPVTSARGMALGHARLRGLALTCLRQCCRLMIRLHIWPGASVKRTTTIPAQRLRSGMRRSTESSSTRLQPKSTGKSRS